MLDFAIMAAALLLASLLQSVLPGIPFGDLSVKIQFLPAVALYYFRRRPWQMSLSAALWAGILIDGLSLLPFGISSFVLFACALVYLAARDLKAPLPRWSALAPGAILTVVLGFFWSAGLLFAGRLPQGFTFLGAAAAFLKASVPSAVAAALADMALSGTERMTGALEEQEESAVI